MTDKEIIEKLQRIVREVSGKEDIVLTNKTTFSELGFTSFGLVQFICAIEDEFDIEIPNSEIKSVNSLSSAVKQIKRHLK